MEWRTEEQKPELWRILDPLGKVMTAAGVAAMVASIIAKTRLIGLACCAVLAVACFGLYLRFPQYYTLMNKKEYKQKGFKAPVKDLDLALLTPCVGLVAQLLHFHIIGWIWFCILTLLLTAAITGLLWIGSREIREQGSVLAVAVFAALSFSLGAVVNGNHYLNLNPEPTQEYTVISIDHTSRRKGPDSYHCIIELEPGEEKRLPITYEQYWALERGDTVEVFRGPGAFGVEYAYIVDIGGETNG